MIGMPVSILNEMIGEITSDNVVDECIKIIEIEIKTTESYINAHESVSIYQENCEKWRNHLEAFDKVLSIMKLIKTIELIRKSHVQ